MKLVLTELLREMGNEADIRESIEVNLREDGVKLTRPVQVELHFTNTGASVLLEGTLATEAELECSRCLKDFRSPLSVRIDEEYAKKGAEFELQDNCLDLDETIRQNILLALPLKPLCKQACEGEK